MHTTEGVGARLQRLRKLRGLTQEALANSAHVSASLVRKVEQGTKPPSAAFVAGTARALGVKPSYLYGTDERDAAEQPFVADAGMFALRNAIEAFDDPQPEGEPLPLAFVNARLTEIAGQVYSLRYSDAAHELAGLLHHLYVLADEPDPAGFHARAALHDAYRLASTVAGRFRQLDLAAIAAERHIQLAPLTGDPMRVAMSAFHRSRRHLQNGDYRAGLRLIGRAHEHLDDTEKGRAMRVQLNLGSSMLAARAGDLDEADGYLTEARALTEENELPSRPFHGIDASATNIVVHWCAVPVELGDGGEAVRRAQLIEVVDPDRPERIGHHHIDMSRAYLLDGDRLHAVESLNQAKAVDPHNTRRHPAVRETVLAIAGADKRASDSLAGFAHWAGIDV